MARAPCQVAKTEVSGGSGVNMNTQFTPNIVGTMALCWRYDLLPFIDQAPLYTQMNTVPRTNMRSWSDQSNVTSTVVLVTIPWRAALRMPAHTPGVRPKSSAYVGASGIIAIQVSVSSRKSA